MRKQFGWLAAVMASCGLTAQHLHAAPTVSQALQLKPIQRGVGYDTPDAEVVSKSTLEAVSEEGINGWEVVTDSGQKLRRFLDTNGDNKVDRWCYYRDGIEVYRDVDGDFNGKADQYRWLGTAGIRWGEDQDEDGNIDSWRLISAEEVTAEIVAAVRDRNAEQFERLLLTEQELSGLRLGEKMTAELTKKITAARENFADAVATQKTIKKSAQWLHFGGSTPGVIPAGTAGSRKDVLVYDNVAAVVEQDGDHAQLSIGTLIRVGEGWRVIDLPQNLTDVSAAPEGFFFLDRSQPLTNIDSASTTPSETPGFNEELQKLVTELERIDQDLVTAGTPAAQAKLNAQRAATLEKLIGNVEPADRENWIRQYADSISAAVQSGAFPDGVERLEKLYRELAQENKNEDLTAFVRFRGLTAEYGKKIQAEDADYAKIQEEWLENLNDFVKAYPESPDAGDAMLQLAMAREFEGDEKEAVDWYKQIVSKFPGTDLAQKATGARRRLESVGKQMQLTGRTLDDRALSMDAYSGRVVVIHYWATWCEPCKQDMKVLKDLYAKYQRNGLSVIGVNLDSDRKSAEQYIKSNPINWVQLHEEGGLDSRLATEMGILTLPTMILVDGKGRVAKRSIHAGEVESELKKLLR